GIGFTQAIVRGQSLPVPAIAEGDGIQGVTPLNHMVTTGYLLGAKAAPAAIVHRYSAGGTGSGRYQQGHEHEPGYAGSADTPSPHNDPPLEKVSARPLRYQPRLIRWPIHSSVSTSATASIMSSRPAIHQQGSPVSAS